MIKAINLDKLYDLRKSFTIIGITGRTGSGCSVLAKLIQDGFSTSVYLPPSNEPKHNQDRKKKIVYKYAQENFEPYYLIEYKYVILLHVFANSFEEIVSDLIRSFPDDITDTTFSHLKEEFDDLTNKIISNGIIMDQPESIKGEQVRQLYEIFNSEQFITLSKKFQLVLSDISPVLRILVLQYYANNIRNGGCAFCEGGADMLTVYYIVAIINRLIKGHKQLYPNKCKIVIDSLRNPLEIMYLKERYSAFYMMAIHREESMIKKYLESKYGAPSVVKQIKRIDETEYKGGSDTEFYKQNVSECIQKSDIHLSNISADQAMQFNKDIKDSTTPLLCIKEQLLKFISLIEQPGIVTPSPEERCMQMAYTAKYNSGCISRQVGAVITDEFYSVKAIGWNNTPEGHTPCLLRNADDLLSNEDKDAFSDYERENAEFRSAFDGTYGALDRSNLKGRNISFCFKCIQNSIKEGKNQVHTRSLHAEESAFLQITKYGGQGIKGGKLFTTASPCELCSKKAYQLGVEVIYYIDLYPGISIEHILKAGTKTKDLKPFQGAIGTAYHKLYSPFMAFKDELALLTGTGNCFLDMTKRLKEENAALKKELTSLKDSKRQMD